MRGRLVGLALALGLVTVGCGDDDGGESAATTASSTTTTTVAEGVDVESPEALNEAVAEELDLEAGDPYESYVAVTDDSEVIAVEVPDVWEEHDGQAIDLGPSLSAAASLEGFNAGTESGVVVVATSSDAIAQQSLDEILDGLSKTECTSDGRADYDDGLYVGRYESFRDCPGGDYVWIAARPEPAEFTVIVGVQVVYEADLQALSHIIDTFEVVGEV